MTYVPVSLPNLAHRVLELELLGLPGTTYTFRSGRELVYRLKISPSPVSRLYACELHVKPGCGFPEMIVVSPNLQALAGTRPLPHIYPYKGQGTKLCLWVPRYEEWTHSMKLIETYVPWTAEWLLYFEHWLVTDEWLGGGEHPTTGDRLARQRKQRTKSTRKDGYKHV